MCEKSSSFLSGNRKKNLLVKWGFQKWDFQINEIGSYRFQSITSD